MASLPQTAAVVCPSRSESQGYVPLEVALWARHDGQIIVAPALGGFTETILSDRTGLLYDPHTPGALTAAAFDAVQPPLTVHAAMRRRSYERVARKRDVVAAYAKTLSAAFRPQLGRH